MTIKKKCISIAATAINIFNGQPAKAIYGGIGHILMFHRVTPKSNKARLTANSYLEVSPEYLEWTINYFKGKNYNFISIEQLDVYLRQPKPQPFVIYTFDDGFKDNYYHAYPIFKKFNIPFTIYITTDFPNQKAILWWNHLEDLVLKQNNISFLLKNNTYQFKTKTTQEKTVAFKKLSKIIKHGESESYTDRLKNIFSPYDINPFSTNNIVLTWDEIKTLHLDPLVTIGSHTVSHPTLNKLSDTESSNEIITAKKIIEKELNSEINHFAYPFGGITEIGNREINISKKSGIKTAVTTCSANIFKDHKHHLHSLPRIAVGESMNKDTFDLILSGIIPMIRNKGKRIITI